MANSKVDKEFIHTLSYTSYISKPCCELAHVKFVKSSSKKYKPDDICKIWCSKSVPELHKYCDVIKIYTFWPFLFGLGSNLSEKLHGCSSESHLCELSLETLCQLEIFEEVTDLAHTFVDVPFFIKGILKIGTEIDNRVFNFYEALDWVRCADIGILQKLENVGNHCWPFLEIFFGEYKHYISKIVLEDYSLLEAFKSLNCETCIKKSESMKKRGNEEFAQEKFDIAITSYTRALEFWPENHLLYGNRSLCFLRIGQFKKALGDGKRSIILKPDWPKGHYRLCDALYFMGELSKALEANERGQWLCRDSPDGIKDLTQQHDRLRQQLEDGGVNLVKDRIMKTIFNKNSSESTSINTQESKKFEKEKKQSDSPTHLCRPKHIKQVADTPNEENKDGLSDFTSKRNENKGKPVNKTGDSEKTREQLNMKVESQLVDKPDAPNTTQQVDLKVSLEMLKTHVRDACTTLLDQRFRSAKQSFAQLLNILDPLHLQELNLALIDYIVIIYGYATALLGIGQPEELGKAEDHFNKIINQYQKVRFNCLAYYGIGKVYLRQNRFPEAKDQFMKSKIMISHKIVPGVLTWPTTAVVIEETREEKLQIMLEDCIEKCKFPPNPDAVCRFQQCQARKIKIYFSDPDFKGFIRVVCSEQCTVEFHVSCWKKLKATKYNDKNDKDFLHEPCFTPDCRGLISKIFVFNSSGLVKCEFERKIKTKKPPRPVVKQKCSSSQNLQIKQEKRLRRKYWKETVLNSSKDCAEECQRGSGVPKHDNHKGNGQKYSLSGDTVLQLIIQNAEKIKAGVHNTFKLLHELLSWWVISEGEYAVYSTDSFSPSEVMEQLIDYLIQKKNRVKTRIFVHVLSDIEEIDPKLHDWIQHLNNNGLKASEIFFARHTDSVLSLELSLVMLLWNEKYGIKLDSMLTCSSEDYMEILSHFCEATLVELRCLIWLLEENREKFPSFHQHLDEYFDKMDHSFTILKKRETETTNNGIKVKNRNRKKPKECRVISVLSGGVGTGTREEDSIFSEESVLGFMDPSEPFRIPDDICDQVAEFEALYNNNTSSSSTYQRTLDNYPDPTYESLYDYFTQILEEHGPMEIDHPLLVEEYEYFPVATRKIVEDAGGLKTFLLESPRFVMMDDLIGLMKHAVMLEENADVTVVEQKIRNEEYYSAYLNNQETYIQSKHRLNPAAKEFRPFSYINKFCLPKTDDTVASNSGEYITTSHSHLTRLVSPYSLSSQTPETTARPLSVSNGSLPSAIPGSHPAFLNEVLSDYSNERLVPGITHMPLLSDSDSSNQCNSVFADYDAVPEALSGCRSVAGNMVASDEMLTVQNLQYIPVKDTFPCEKSLGQVQSPSNESECNSVKMEIENKSVTRNIPRSRMISIQVDQELTDRGVNTLPLQPYETQQGDMLRMEKEHRVLQEQLKDASEKYEHLKCQSSEETCVLEEELTKNIEGNKLTKRELDWFQQDLEMEMKKWQQEKKENQEGLKAGKNKIRKLTETNEMYRRYIDEKDKQYKLHLDEFLESSNKFENEKVKMEELIKKSHDDYQDCIKRAVASEVSVLENWKDAELYKLCRTAANAEATLNYLKVINSHSAFPQLTLQIDSWESFISTIKEEIGKAESQFEERICMVKSGAFLNTISKVEISELQPPLDLLSAKQEMLPINDPAIVMYSAAAPNLPLNLLPTFSDNSTVNMRTESKMSRKDSKPRSANKGMERIPSEQRSQPHSDQICLSESFGNSRRHVQDIQLQHDTWKEQAATAGLDHTKAANEQLCPKPFENIIDKLKTIFPNYTSSEFENFIKEVKVKNKKLSTDELLSQVTEFILDHPNKKKVHLSSGKIEKPSSGGSGQGPGQTPKGPRTSERSVPSLTKCRPANEKTKKASLPPRSSQLPWKIVGGTSKSTWKKLSDANDNDPCVICHEELSSEMWQMLDCGHTFHKACIGPWVKEHSTCPTCRHHILLLEDYPELPGRNLST